MANYTGQTYIPATKQQDENFGLLTTVMQMKQGKYDANKAAIQQTLNAFGQLQVLRPEDNEYIASKLSSLEGELGSMGNLDLSKASYVDPIMNKVKSAARDPFILSALENTQKFRGFQAQVEKLKEKSPDKYSDTNYGFALSQAGFEDYMSGKNDKIGSLNYTEYVNVNKNMAERAKEFAKYVGEEQLIGSKQHGNYHTVDIYGKVVRKDELQNYLMGSLDEKERKQLHINAWSNFKDKDDKMVNDYMLSVSNERLKELESNYGALKAQSDSGEKGLEEQLSSYKQIIKEHKSKIQSNSFSREDAYNDYINKSIGDIADAFDMNIVTKKDVDNTFFEETKFMYDQQQDAIKLAMKQKELDLKNLELFGGTRTDVLQDTKKEDTSDIETLSKENFKNTTYLKEYLLKTNPDFADMGANEQYQYMVNLDISNPANSKIEITPELRRLHTSFKQSQGALVKINQETTEQIKNISRGSFDDMMEGVLKDNQLDLDSTAKYLPITTSILKAAKNNKKKTSFGDLTSDQQKIVEIELTKAWMQEKGSDLDEDVRKTTNRALISLEKSIKNKNLLNSSKNVTSKLEEEQSFTDKLLSAAKTPYTIGKTGLGLLGTTLGAVKDFFTDGNRYAEERLAENEIKDRKNIKEAKKSIGDLFNFTPVGLQYNIAKGVGTGIFTEDTSLSKINARDVGRGQGIGDRFDNMFETIKNNTREAATQLSPTLQSKYGYTFSTQVKGQKDIAEYLKASVLNSESIKNGEIKLPTTTNAFTVQREGEQFRIFFNAGTGKDLRRESVLVSSIPDQIKSVLDLNEDSWNTSMYNPNLDMSPVQIQPVNNYEEGRQKIENMFKAFGNEIPLKVQNVLADTKNGIFKPSIEYTRQDIKKEVYQKNKEIVDKFLNQTFIAKPFRTPDGRFATNITYSIINQNGQEEQAEEIITHAVNEKNDMVFLLDYFSKVDQIKKEQLKTYE